MAQQATITKTSATQQEPKLVKPITAKPNTPKKEPKTVDVRIKSPTLKNAPAKK